MVEDPSVPGGVEDEVVRFSGDPTVVMDIMDPVVIMGIVDPVVITDMEDPVVIMGMEDMDPIVVAIVATIRKIPTRIALVTVLMTQMPMSPCTGSARGFHPRRGRRGFLPLKPNTRLRKLCTALRSRLSRWGGRGPARQTRT